MTLLSSHLKTMKKYEPKYVNDEIAIQGRQSAALFTAGVAAGNNLTQQNLVNQVNRLTAFAANGLTTPVDWRHARTTVTPPYCGAYIEAVGTQFVARFMQGHEVFNCFLASLKPKPMIAPPGTPGA
jgi:hypothetical protein